jgi:hypothetical protein
LAFNLARIERQSSEQQKKSEPLRLSVNDNLDARKQGAARFRLSQGNGRYK